MPNNALSLIGYWWICLSFLSTGCLLIGFYVPHWIVGSISLNGRRHTAYFGGFRRCNYPIFDEGVQHFRMSDVCGIYQSFQDIPSIWWQLGSISIGCGCFLALVLELILLPACCLQGIVTKSSSVLIGLFQVVAALGVTLGCILFALGWDNNEVKDACGPHVGKFVLGDCHLGWAYVCMLSGAAMLLICGMLSACSTSRSIDEDSIAECPQQRVVRRFRKDSRKQSFDAEALIDNNLHPSSRSASRSTWQRYDGTVISPFVPRHSELV
ncbi:Lipoma HMGIC fusion partner-like protein [Aphelenchoides bicaudatus]|nr:Lipoma HMGIC fusion partner-like protein [Aphelenchoides bicaudatus]